MKLLLIATFIELEFFSQKNNLILMKRGKDKIIESNHEKVFTNIYKTNFWGGQKGEFYSGSGSYSKYIDKYSDVISLFIIQNNLKQIVEIGCGDFNITKKIINYLDRKQFDYYYTGYDIVKDLVEGNKKLYGTQRINFTIKNGIDSKITMGDLLIIRQVLQHLDNKSIQKIIAQFKKFNYVIVSEHQLSKKFDSLIEPNIDKKGDGDIRIKDISGVYLEKEPFNCNIISLIHSIPES